MDTERMMMIDTDGAVTNQCTTSAGESVNLSRKRKKEISVSPSDQSKKVNIDEPAIAILNQGRGKSAIVKSIELVNTQQISRFKAEVKIKEKEIANKILSENGKLHKMRAYIPKRAEERWGVITDWPDSIPELINDLDPGQGRVVFERLKKRRIIDKNITWTESTSILCKFKENHLPTSLSLYGGKVGLRVKPYVRNVKICFRCLRFGHIQKFCRNKEKKCFRCGETFHGQCSNDFHCLNCNGKHGSLDKACPIFTREKNIAKIMAYSNTAYETARQRALQEESIFNPVPEKRPSQNQQEYEYDYDRLKYGEEPHTKIFDKPNTHPRREYWEDIPQKWQNSKWSDKNRVTEMKRNLASPNSNRYNILQDFSDEEKFVRPPTANKKIDENLKVERRLGFHQRDHREKQHKNIREEFNDLFDKLLEMARSLNLEEELESRIQNRNNNRWSNSAYPRRQEHHKKIPPTMRKGQKTYFMSGEDNFTNNRFMGEENTNWNENNGVYTTTQIRRHNSKGRGKFTQAVQLPLPNEPSQSACAGPSNAFEGEDWSGNVCADNTSTIKEPMEVQEAEIVEPQVLDEGIVVEVAEEVVREDSIEEMNETELVSQEVAEEEEKEILSTTE